MSQQRFLSSPTSLTVSPGTNTTLSCLVENMGGECRWQKDGKVIMNKIRNHFLQYILIQPVGMYPGKYSLANPGVKGDCSLSITSVAMMLDDGEWECQVTSTSFQSQDALASRPARVTVQGNQTIDK